MPSNETRHASAAGLMDLLLRSGEALRNWRALVTLIGTGVATIVIAVALASSGSAILMFLALLIGYIVFSIGVSATGILLTHLCHLAQQTLLKSIAYAFSKGVMAQQVRVADRFRKGDCCAVR